jgi:tetratricopeptide (TPR) repeat protein
MRRTITWTLAALALITTASVARPGADDAGQERVQATSLLGKPLRPMPASEEVQADRLANLAQARADLEDAVIWYGRRTAYLGRYREAIDIYGEGLRHFPDSYKLLRHRGHRLISVREFAAAIEDLERASALAKGVPDEVEPDGLPNRLNIPTSTSHTNIYYHLGLARYVRGEYAKALAAYERCLEFSKNNDMRCATTYWHWLTLRRLGRDAEASAALAPITADMEIIENVEYHRLLLMFKGELEPAEALAAAGADDDGIGSATTGYGVAAWHLVEGRRDEATAMLERVVAGPAWPAFGHIAAEAELARMRK